MIRARERVLAALTDEFQIARVIASRAGTSRNNTSVVLRALTREGLAVEMDRDLNGHFLYAHRWRRNSPPTVEEGTP